MKIWALSDPHLSFDSDKPMDIFGDNWSEYVSKIKENWLKLVAEDDIVIVAGDISWALKLEDAKKDLEWLGSLPGTKIIVKGNHELWWNSLVKVKSILPSNVLPIQNDCIRIGNYLFCGTRGWQAEELNKPLSNEDKRIYDREVIRMGLTLKEMEKMRKSDDKIIFIMHFPPFNSKKEETPFTQAFKEHKIDAVVYGHLHGKGVPADLQVLKDGIKYYLTSTDQINHCPVQIRV